MLVYVETVISYLAAAVSSRTCTACDDPLSRDAIFCAPCAASVVLGSSFRHEGLRVDAGAMYGGAVSTALNRFKHHDRPDLARPLAHLMRRALDAPMPDFVVPVPLHRVRLAERGYNQSALLSSELARMLDVPVRYDLLKRVVPTRPQQELSASERRKNVVGAFAVDHELREERVLLVDDVCTTGATLNACARALRTAGAHVRAQVVAIRASA